METGDPGVFVVSIDLEMSWGRLHHEEITDFPDERELISDLLGLLDRYGISATWATVGHLLLDDCGPFEGTKHPELVRPAYEWLERDWLDPDPVSNVVESPTWYAPDVIAEIANSSTPQEIASHSFSHLIAGDPGCTREAFRSDLDAAIAVARDRQIEIESFVYPRNSIGHVQELAAAGIKAYRGPRPKPDDGAAIQMSTLARMIDRAWPLRASAVMPSREGDVVNVPQTYLLDPNSRMRRRLGSRGWIGLINRRLQHAVRTQSLFHLWFHPHNITDSPEDAWKALDSVFGKARRLIDQGRLMNMTMAEVAAAVP